MKRKIISNYIKEVYSTPGSDAEWFGYYNYDPLSHDKTKLLCNRSKVDGIAPEKGMVIELGYYDLPDGIWHHIGVSDSWNWQQACMMQWIPGIGNENKVIYNCSKKNHLISVVHDISTGENRELRWPIYGLLPDGKKSLALNMERSYWCRAYHYQSVVNKEYDVPVPDDDGIFEIDIVHNTRKRIVDIHDVIELDPDTSFQSQKHWLEHIMISPSGKRFCFLHRYSPVENTYQYQTRLCIANIDGSDLQVVPGWRDYSFSHFGWRDDNSFCIYSVKISPIQKNLLSLSNEIPNKNHLLKKFKRDFYMKAINYIPENLRRIIKGGDKIYMYQFFIIKNGLFVLRNKWQHKLMSIDGHPSFTRDGRFMLTDTYADNNQYRKFLVFNPNNGKCLKLAEFYEPFMGNPARCDLHPKLCRDNNFIVIDSTSSGKHQMILFKINWELIEKEVCR